MPVLRDGPLALRAWSEDDAPAVHRACQDPEIQRWNPAVPRPYRLEHALAFVRGEAVPDELALAFTVEGAVAGCIGMKPVPDRIGHVGYWCAPEHRGRGWTARALRLFAAHAFGELGVERLELVAEPGNAGSLRVAAKAGFVREGVLRAYVRHPDGRRADAVMHSLLPSDLRASRS
ncbi:MAG TPA: GNAT family protein [Solirubrobacteraceae bacterium]|nr:GNAT family protein [Solirubrobacteraceae bacterium]